MTIWKMSPAKVDYLLSYWYKEYPKHNITFFYKVAGRIVEEPEDHLWIELGNDFIIK